MIRSIIEQGTSNDEEERWTEGRRIDLKEMFGSDDDGSESAQNTYPQHSLDK